MNWRARDTICKAILMLRLRVRRESCCGPSPKLSAFWPSPEDSLIKLNIHAMRKAALLAALGCLLLCQPAHTLPTAPQEPLGDLLIAPSNMQTTKTDGRYTAQPGFHYVRVAITLKNVGHTTVCASLSARIDTSLGGGKRYGRVSLTAKNGTKTASGGSIHQMLPGEEAEGYIIFEDLRDGTEPKSLTIHSSGQSCESYSNDVEAITYTITSKQNHLAIESKPATPKEVVRAATAQAPQTAIPVTPKPCESADASTHATAPIAVDLPDPVYTDEARRAKAEGKVQFCATVGVDGLLHDIKPLNHLGSGLDEQALSALHEWRFTPAMLDGKSVPRVILVEVSFRLHMP